ncbi:MAG: hypothetical protein Alpg2KO_08940 [Alphaproteobacteria bacterium]
MSTQDIPLEALMHATSHMANVYIGDMSKDEMDRFGEAIRGPFKAKSDELARFASNKPDGVDQKEWGLKAGLRSIELVLLAAAHVKGRDHLLANINPGMKSEPFKAAFRKHGATELADLLEDAPKADRRRRMAPKLETVGI